MSIRIHDQAKASVAPSSAVVGRGVLQRKCACGGSPGLDGECAECRKKRLQRKASHCAESTSVPAIVHEVLRSPGQPLAPTVRARMEPAFGHDFRTVQIHTGARAKESAQAVSALAYTVGSHIVFGQAFQPGTASGQALLAHELTHVVQQSASTQPGSGLTIGSPATHAEREAERAAASWGLDSARNTSAGFAGPQVQRQVDDSMGQGAERASTSSCHTCQIPGGIGVCCYADNAPMVPECWDLATKIIDECKGPRASCLQEAQCAQCQCIARTRGEQYCQCTGIV